MHKAYALKHREHNELLRVDIESTPHIDHRSCTRTATTSFSLTTEGNISTNPIWLSSSPSEAQHIANTSHSDDNNSFEIPYNPFDSEELEVVEIEINPVSID